MPLDFHTASESVFRSRQSRGRVSHARGDAAEEQVLRHYQRAGARLLHRRWRGCGGEIDLILQCGEDVIFVEVKASSTHARAIESLRPQQVTRLCAAAEEFIGTLPRGALTPMRMDVALVDGQGEIDILENALMAV